MRLRKDIKDHVEAELRYFEQSKRDLGELREEIIDGTPARDDGGGGGQHFTGRPTESKAIRLATNRRLKQLETTIRAIETVVEELPREKVQLVELKYWQRPRLLTDAGIGQEIGCSDKTVRRWTDSIIQAIAVEMGLIDEAELKGVAQ